MNTMLAKWQREGLRPSRARLSLGQMQRQLTRWADVTWAEIELARLLDVPDRQSVDRRELRELDEATMRDATQFEEVSQSELAAITRQVLATLTAREEWVIRMRFGVGEATDHTLEDVAAELGVSRERVRQIEARALRKLQHPDRARRVQSFIEPSILRGLGLKEAV